MGFTCVWLFLNKQINTINNKIKADPSHQLTLPIVTVNSQIGHPKFTFGETIDCHFIKKLSQPAACFGVTGRSCDVMRPQSLRCAGRRPYRGSTRRPTTRRSCAAGCAPIRGPRSSSGSCSQPTAAARAPSAARHTPIKVRQHAVSSVASPWRRQSFGLFGL